jgi:hypothetical protein
VKVQFLPAFILTWLALTLPAFGATQTQGAASDPQGLLAAQSVAMLPGGNGITDITLIGSVTSVAGSNGDTGQSDFSASFHRTTLVVGVTVFGFLDP